MLRRLLLLAFAAAGAWGALRVVDLLARQAGGHVDFHLTNPSIPLLVSAGLVGARRTGATSTHSIGRPTR